MATVIRGSELDLLRQVAIFSNCDDHELRRIRRHGDWVTVTRGAVVHPAGTSLRWLYVVVDGRVAADIGDEASVAGPGEALGVRTLLAGCAPPAQVLALTPATVFVLGAREFLGLLGQLAGLGSGLARHLACDRDPR